MLREFDKLDVDIILAEAIEEKGIGSAIMNRMEKAAGYDIENV
jgi:L-threonylcarbamoyladenylate synthase